jgi:hypothetical protein
MPASKELRVRVELSKKIMKRVLSWRSRCGRERPNCLFRSAATSKTVSSSLSVKSMSVR